MIVDMEGEYLLPADYSPPTLRASRQRRTSQVAFVEETSGSSGMTTQPLDILRTTIDTIARFLKVVLLLLVGVALLIALVALLQFFLMQNHIISDPRIFAW